MKKIYKILVILLAVIALSACHKMSLEVNHTTIHEFGNFTLEHDEETIYYDAQGREYTKAFFYQYKPEKTLLGELAIYGGETPEIVTNDMKDELGKIYGQEIIFYLERNREEGYQVGSMDILKRQVHILYGERGPTGATGPAGKTYSISMSMDEVADCSGIQLSFEITLDGEITQSGSRCLPAGPQGEAAINHIPRSVPLLNPITGEKVGFTFEVWEDSDGEAGITAGDKCIISEAFWYVGHSISKEVFDGYTVTTHRYLYLGVWEELEIITEDGAIGQTGPNGENASINVFLSKNVTMIVGGKEEDFVEIQTWLDENNDRVVSVGDIYMQSFFIPVNRGLDGSFVTFTLREEFQDLTKAEAEEMGFEFKGPFYVSRDGIYATPNETTLTMVRFPMVRDDADLLSQRIRGGSTKTSTWALEEVDKDDNATIVDTIRLEANPNFNWQDPSTYQQFDYHADLDNIDHTDVKHIQLRLLNDNVKSAKGDVVFNNNAKCANSDAVFDSFITVYRDRGHLQQRK